MLSGKSELTVTVPLSAAVLCLGMMASSVPAAAQDSPWAGFYAGVNGGVTWSDSQADATIASTSNAPPTVSHPIVPPVDIAAINATTHFNSKHNTGFTGGVEAGYNYVMADGLMLGIETDLNIYNISADRTGTVTSPTSINPPTKYSLTQSVDTDFLWTLRPRIGYAKDNFLVFASGGLALTSTQYEGSFIDSRSPGNTVALKSKDNGKTGWTIGAGAAYAITPNISLKGEYLFEDFGHSDFSTNSASELVSYNADVHLKSHLFRTGIDYRF